MEPIFQRPWIYRLPAFLLCKPTEAPSRSFPKANCEHSMRINARAPLDWRDLQTQAARVLSESGLTAEVEKTIQLVRGTVTVDVHARDLCGTPPLLYLCECKNWATPVSKETVHAFRTVVNDSGAHCGFLISKAGFQSGLALRLK